ncbi:spore germination protein [Evansella sp. LMS18]|uniref:spore germination protein n=1 Tax=Evansella sp. LMS18 TaxID=2924033 RepID=UPI0020D1100A|nr:spore germination protein [Evansella sp. LMS18]UTR10079.1 spore germination protein [Evansella sp. LMS18]
MPAIVGAIKVNAISSSGVFNVGDVFRIAPVSTAKTFSGAGSFNTGDNLNVRNNYSVTRVNDSDGVDQNITAVI